MYIQTIINIDVYLIKIKGATVGNILSTSLRLIICEIFSSYNDLLVSSKLHYKLINKVISRVYKSIYLVYSQSCHCHSWFIVFGAQKCICGIHIWYIHIYVCMYS